MKKRVILMFLMLFFVFTAASCSSSNPSQSNGGSSGGSGQQAPAVSIENFSFKPQALTIKAGTTVTWTNNDTVVHNIKSAEFSSPDMKQGDTFQHKFDKAGTYDYNCGVHPTMTGKIIVE